MQLSSIRFRYFLFQQVVQRVKLKSLRQPELIRTVVIRNGIEPGRKTRSLLKGVKLSKHLQKDVVGKVLGEIMVSGHGQTTTIHFAEIPLIKGFEALPGVTGGES